MANIYHIKDDGMPGRCSARTPESCPKSKDTPGSPAFHGDLQAATAESERRFQAALGLFATEERESEAADAGLVESVTTVYKHPLGKVITVRDGAILSIKTKDGKDTTSSATATELADGYGRWKEADRQVEMVSPAVKSMMPAKTNATLRSEYAEASRVATRAAQELRDFGDETRAYDHEYGAEEGRAYTFVNGQRVESKDLKPGPGVFYEPRLGHADRRQRILDKLRDAREAEDKAQTQMEEAGLGHEIPDDGNTIRVSNQAQKLHLRDELLGQISDGYWENSSNNPWQDWANAKVIVDPSNPGRNFSTSRDTYQLNSARLLDIVGDRMLENVRTTTGDANYSNSQMMTDLRDLRRIFKTQRPVHRPAPPRS